MYDCCHLLTDHSARSGPAVPNVDGGIKVSGNTFLTTTFEPLFGCVGRSFHVSFAWHTYAEAEPWRPSKTLLHGGINFGRQML